MSQSEDPFDLLTDAAWRGDLDTIRSMVKAGFDLALTNKYGETVLSEAIRQLCVVDDLQAHRYEVVKTLLELGFDPNQLDQNEEKSGPLIGAMLSMDTEMLRLLLDAGARPNDTGGTGANSTLYDWAVEDYVYEIWDVNKFPKEPGVNDLIDQDSYLVWLDNMAMTYQRQRPEHLILLRERGARCWSELHQNVDHQVTA